MDPRRRDNGNRPLRTFDGPLENGRLRTDRATRRRSAPTARPARPGRSGRRTARVGKTAIACLGIAVIAALVAHSIIGRGLDDAGGGTASQEETAHSTPMHAWRKGEVPFLYQIDPQWSDEPYAGGNIHENGCGPTCLSMVYVSLTGKTDLGPAEMARFSEQNGFTVDGMTAWALMTDGAAMLGITGSEIPADPDVVRDELEEGHPIICSVRPGDFTTTGHFIVLAGLTEDGQVMVRDPNSARNGDHPWDLDRILGQCANLWSFSA